NTSSAATSLSWSNNGQVFSSMGNPTQLFDSAGVFLIQLAIDDGVCTDTSELSFTVTAAPNVGETLSDPVCPGDMNGMIDLNLNGGVMPFSYTWSNGEITEDISGLDSGQYSIQITDGVGCVVEDTFNLNLLGGLTAAFSITTGGSYVQLDDLTDSTAVSWAWDFGDGNTSNDQNPLHQYAFFGNYTVCLIATDGFGCTDTICQEASISTAIERNRLLPLEIFPNPTSDQVQLSLPASLNAQLDISVYDAQGKLVLQTERSAQPEITLDIQSLASGLYTILLSDGESYFQGKLLKK
ncbi:MAG: PKD domain-containing protein, partial [Bacteroidota bacterium]